MQEVGTDCSFHCSNRPQWLPVLSSQRLTQPACPQASTVRDLWLSGRSWDNLRSCPGLDCDAQAPLERGYESQNGCDYGTVSNPLDLLRSADWVATSDCMEPGRCIDQFSKRRSLLSFRQQTKLPTLKLWPCAWGSPAGWQCLSEIPRSEIPGKSIQ